MRTVLNILNFILGGFATTLGWLLATILSVALVITLPLWLVALRDAHCGRDYSVHHYHRYPGWYRQF